MLRHFILIFLITSCQSATTSKFNHRAELPNDSASTSVSHAWETTCEQINEPINLDTFTSETYRFFHQEGFGYGHYTLYTVSEQNLLLKIKKWTYDTVKLTNPQLFKTSVSLEHVQKLNLEDWKELKELLRDSYYYSLEPQSHYETVSSFDGKTWSIEGINYMNERMIPAHGNEFNKRKVERNAPFKGKLAEVANFFFERHPL